MSYCLVKGGARILVSVNPCYTKRRWEVLILGEQSGNPVGNIVGQVTRPEFRIGYSDN